jgi:putative ABC transport system permease protein
MLGNYFTVALRSLLRNKAFGFIHIVGLSIGISAALVIFLMVQYEFNFDKFEKDKDRIFRVVMDFSFNGTEGHTPAVPAPLAAAVQNEVTGVEETVPIMQFQGDATATVTVNQGNNQPAVFKKQSDIIFTNAGYFELLPYQWIAGSPGTSLREPFSVVLTETRAQQYFPTSPLHDIMGKEILYNENLSVTIVGVVKDLTENTDLTSKEFISYSTISKTNLQDNFMMAVWDDWMSYSKLYIKLSTDTDQEKVENQLTALLKKHSKSLREDSNRTMAFRLQPLQDVHFNTTYSGFGQRTAHKPTLYGLLAIATFLLILACINFTNLKTAQASQRAKEIGIRKTVGSSRKQLIVLFLMETFCLTSIATVVSTSITPMILDLFADFIPPGLTFNPVQQPSILAFLFLLTIVVSVLSGVYPALVLSRFRPVMVLRNQAVTGLPNRRAGMRKALTVFQFSIAQFFVIVAFFVSKQIYFSLNQDLGYRKEAIVNVILPFDTVADHRERIRNEIESIPEVQMVSMGFLPPATNGPAFGDISYQRDGENVKANVQVRWGDVNYIKVYGIPLIAGRNINGGENTNEALINETYAKVLGFTAPEEAIGKELTMRNGTKTPIVGIMRDFHESSTHGAIGPIVFLSQKGNFVHVALMPKEATEKVWQNALHKIQQVVTSVYPERDFEFKFYDDSISNFYTVERNTARLLNWAMALSILISCLGLLGLVIYTAEARSKEIGVRKILGASVQNIVSILSSEFIALVMIAFVISSPLAWWATNQWLQNFAYKTSISWWVFAASGLFLLMIAVSTLSLQVLKTSLENPVKSLRSE